jgi:hypothetical protein
MSWKRCGISIRRSQAVPRGNAGESIFGTMSTRCRFGRPDESQGAPSSIIDHACIRLAVNDLNTGLRSLKRCMEDVEGREMAAGEISMVLRPCRRLHHALRSSVPLPGAASRPPRPDPSRGGSRMALGNTLPPGPEVLLLSHAPPLRGPSKTQVSRSMALGLR